eukprot:7613054-Pyramimonas_sp.AAC.1
MAALSPKRFVNSPPPPRRHPVVAVPVPRGEERAPAPRAGFRGACAEGTVGAAGERQAGGRRAGRGPPDPPRGPRVDACGGAAA